MILPTAADRADRGACIIQFANKQSAGHEEECQMLAEALTDLRFWADEMGVDFNNALIHSANNVKAESPNESPKNSL